MGNVIYKELREQKRSLFFWALGLVILVTLTVSFYPSVRDSAQEINAFINNLRPGLKNVFLGQVEDIVSPVGYLSSRLFSFLMPILLIIFTIGYGASVIAGEEERGTLSIILANPISRIQLLMEKFMVLVFNTLLITTIVFLTLFLTSPLFSLEISSESLLNIVISLGLFGLSFGSIALFVGATTGSRGTSIAVTLVIAVVSFFIKTFAPFVEILEKIQFLSLFYHYSGENPMTEGLQINHIAVFVCVIVISFVLGLIVFQKRDLKI